MRLLPALAGLICATYASASPVQLSGFAIDETEVSVAQFAAFAAKTTLTTAAERDGGGFEWGAGWQRRPGWTYRAPQGLPAQSDEPAVHVSWTEADAYCKAAGGRLPTRAEWLSAAYTEQRPLPPNGFATGVTYPYPVGADAKGMNTNSTQHVPVGTTKQGVNGLFDMGANVWEWLADRQGDAALTAGGSWWYGPSKTRAEGMQWKPASFYAVYVGFRCVY